MAQVSDESVAKSTGRTWDEWFAVLEERGARGLEHKEIVRLLREDEGVESGWWQQNVTVEYEKHIGRRILGQTADAAFQVGVRRTISATASDAWSYLTGEGVAAWLQGAPALPAEPKATVELADGGSAQLRSIDAPRKLRVAIERPGQPRSTLQLYVEDKGDRASVGFHHERLPDAATREAMRDHWRATLDAIQHHLEG